MNPLFIVNFSFLLAACSSIMKCKLKTLGQKLINQEEIRKIVPNEKQFECIKTLEGSVMVLAGPGTGKTFTIIQRIKYMLEQGILPETILCLTFSEAAANEMKARIVKEIGTIGSAVTIHTYHAFCNEIIKQHPNEFELLDGVKLIDDISKRNLMKQTLDEFSTIFYRTKWGDAYYYINELLKNVDEIKKNQVTEQKYFNTLNTHPEWQGKLDELMAEYKEREEKGKLVKTFLEKVENHKKKIGKAKEAWEIYKIYDKKMKQNNFIDFNDMINLVLDAFEADDDFLQKVAGKYDYFLVDEYQDTNYSQNQIILKLVEGSNRNNVFVVGDDDQIIYGFQGAQLDTIEKFLKKYPDTKVICLNENNRSTQTILDLSYCVISQDQTRLETNPEFTSYGISKRLTAKNQKITCKDKKVQIHGFNDIIQENNFIAENIEKLICSTEAPKNDSGEIDLSQIAILTRENSELETFAELLKFKNIPFQINTTKSIFELKSSIILYFYIKTVENNELYADKLFGLLLSEPFKFNEADYNFLLEQNAITHKDFITTIKENTERNWSNKEKVLTFIKIYNELKENKSQQNLKNIIIEIINKTGLLEYFLNIEADKTENILAIKKIVDEAASLNLLDSTATLKDFIDHLDTAFNENIPITIDKDNYIQNAVQLRTLHKSKGLEFEYVYLPNLTSKNWEAKKNTDKSSLPIEKNSLPLDKEEIKKAEQLKLLFVGISRAKHSLCMTYSNSTEGTSRELTSYLAFLTENDCLFESSIHELNSSDYCLELCKTLTKTDFNYKKSFEDEIRARLKNFVMSPSSLNCYLNCPRNFLYSHILKIPISEGDFDKASYGSAIHSTLELAVDELKEKGNYPDKNTFTDIFVKKLNKQRFTSKLKREEYQKRGEESLNRFYPHFIETSAHRIFATEYQFDYIPVENYFIKGKIDRIEKNNDGTFGLYDYKTGTSKSKSQIADGKDYESYLNQLRFYKFAFETQNKDSNVSQTGLIYVEEHDKNFSPILNNDDNNIIKDKIVNTYENIYNFNFSPIEQDDKKCRFCNYKQLCRLNVI